jgi:hypothetical protein
MKVTVLRLKCDLGVRPYRASSAGSMTMRRVGEKSHPDDPVGPEPVREAPDQRAAWYEAFAALGPGDQSDVRAMPDGRLWLIRDAYTAETAWAPRHVGKELRLSRLGAFDAGLGAIRADAENSRRPQSRRPRPRRPA